MSAFSPNRPDERVFLSLAALLLLAGCAAPKSALLPDISAWESRQAVLAGLESWEFGGRIAVRTGNDGFNGKLRYAQDEEGFQATVSGPLGIGTVRLEGDDRSVTLTDKDGIRTELHDAELELRYRYGWTIPVASLRYWALGIPDPAEDNEFELAYARLRARVEAMLALPLADMNPAERAAALSRVHEECIRGA